MRKLSKYVPNLHKSMLKIGYRCGITYMLYATHYLRNSHYQQSQGSNNITKFRGYPSASIISITSIEFWNFERILSFDHSPNIWQPWLEIMNLYMFYLLSLMDTRSLNSWSSVEYNSIRSSCFWVAFPSWYACSITAEG